MTIFGEPLAVPPFPAALSTSNRGFVHPVKLFARALAVSGLRIETLSRSPVWLPKGMNIDLHSDCSGKGGRADKGGFSELVEEEAL